MDWSERVRSLGRPAVLAHRGASADAAENSLSALRRAVELGADGVEFDVQPCASGELVVFHDRTLGRVCGVPGELTTTPWASLQTLSLDAIDRRRGRTPSGAGIPLLSEWLDACPPGFLLNLEIKADDWTGCDWAPRCMQALRDTGRVQTSIVSSFEPLSLAAAVASDRRRSADDAPAMTVGMLVEDTSRWPLWLATGLASGARAAHLPHRLVTPRVVRWLHRAGWLVATWTVDAPSDIHRVCAADVDVVISNRPDLARKICDTYQRPARG